MKIVGKQIQKKLKKISEFRLANSIGMYYPIGSEVSTQDIMQDAISNGKEIFLPKVIGEGLEFRKIKDFGDLEKGDFDIMEPKEGCTPSNKFDVILVPTVGISRDGYRLGYGYGYYDRFLAKRKVVTIALTYAKQIVKSVPSSEGDARIDWIVTEDEYFKTS